NATIPIGALIIPVGPTIAPLTAVSDDQMWRGPVTLGTSVTIDVQTDSRLSIFGTIDDAINTSGPSNLTKIGPGKLVLGEANTYGGATDIKQGVINVRDGNALGVGVNATVTVEAGTGLEMQGDITISNKNLIVQGAGDPTAFPSVPENTLQWFARG